MFNHYVNQQDFYAQWSKIEPLNRDGSDQRPGQRGGHQMVIDPATGMSLIIIIIATTLCPNRGGSSHNRGGSSFWYVLTGVDPVLTGVDPENRTSKYRYQLIDTSYKLCFQL